jgi:hypothetical protein
MDIKPIFSRENLRQQMLKMILYCYSKYIYIICSNVDYKIANKGTQSTLKNQIFFES